MGRITLRPVFDRFSTPGADGFHSGDTLVFQQREKYPPWRSFHVRKARGSFRFSGLWQMVNFALSENPPKNRQHDANDQHPHDTDSSWSAGPQHRERCDISRGREVKITACISEIDEMCAATAVTHGRRYGELPHFTFPRLATITDDVLGLR